MDGFTAGRGMYPPVRVPYGAGLNQRPIKQRISTSLSAFHGLAPIFVTLRGQPRFQFQETTLAGSATALISEGRDLYSSALKYASTTLRAT